ncbi:MAG: hypothetical protein LBD42_06460 [Desulfovibrio sp.]|jgi:hypothetical protein|nr:hypothetical protein [Desulfovibrio sp.]
MMRTIFLFVLLFVAAFSSGACRKKGVSPVSPVGSAASVDKARKFTGEDMRAAILRACMDKGWSPAEPTPGLIEASLEVRGKHAVVVDIPYTNQQYQIKYKRSVNMKEHELESDGSVLIHPNYNKWVGALDKAVKANIARTRS